MYISIEWWCSDDEATHRRVNKLGSNSKRITQRRFYYTCSLPCLCRAHALYSVLYGVVAVDDAVANTKS